MIKKKGSIVPRYIIKAFEKKSQHLVKFGCDVKIEGNKVTALSDGDMFIIPSDTHCNLRKKKGTQKRKVKGYVLNNSIRVYGDFMSSSVIFIEVPCQEFKLPENVEIGLNI